MRMEDLSATGMQSEKFYFELLDHPSLSNVHRARTSSSDSTRSRNQRAFHFSKIPAGWTCIPTNPSLQHCRSTTPVPDFFEMKPSPMKPSRQVLFPAIILSSSMAALAAPEAVHVGDALTIHR